MIGLVGNHDRTGASKDGPAAYPPAEFAIDPDAVRQALESGGHMTLRVVDDEGTDGDAGDAASGGPGRSRGRPRSQAAHLAILQAALDLLAEVGYDGLSIEAVAQRAGVSKATIYRRWTSKAALTIDVLESIAASHATIDTGTTRGDLLELLDRVFLAINHSQYGAVLTALASELQRNPEIAETFRGRFLAARRGSMLVVLQRGIERGELRPDCDLDLVIDLLVAPLYYRRLVSGMPLTPEYAAAVVDAVLSGVGLPSA
jgi:AcrR family transcriptional regulator